ncbi:MAG: NOG1 family protein [Halobacteriales archaeon]
MIFEALPTTPRSDELIDQAFSRAARSGRAKDGREAQESMLQTASNVLSDNVENVVTAWPDFDAIDPFYYDLANAVLGGIPGFDPAERDAEDAVGVLRGYLAELRWAANKTHEIGREYQARVRGTSVDTARKFRKQAFARMADVIEQVETELERVGTARDELRQLPDIRPDEPTIVVAGYPNVGKSSFVNAVTRATNEIAEYPFTTRGINVGHLERDRIRYQLVDTPGLLDRPEAERNDIEEQAVSALVHAADAVLVMVDASETCGYQLDAQLALRDAVAERFAVPVLTICNKADLSTAVEADAYTSVTAETEVAGRKSADAGRHVESLDSVLDRAVEAVGYEPELPYEG